MCQELLMYPRPDAAPAVVETQAELAAVLGGYEHFVFDSRFEPLLTPDACLCPLDLGATLAAAGYMIRPGQDDGLGQIIAVRREGAPAQ